MKVRGLRHSFGARPLLDDVNLDIDRGEFAAQFRTFQDHITRLENTVRWRWSAGDVAVWDNRATQHNAINDYGDQPRVVRRVTVDRDAPVAIDGRRSVTRFARAGANAA